MMARWPLSVDDIPLFHAKTFTPTAFLDVKEHASFLKETPWIRSKSENFTLRSERGRKEQIRCHPRRQQARALIFLRAVPAKSEPGFHKPQSMM
jgi:hypothetical protein